MLDRGVAKVVKIQGKGADFPFNGGTATSPGRRCCSALDNPVPVTRRTGGAGAVRDLLKSADLAVANFENPAPDAFRYHTEGDGLLGGSQAHRRPEEGRLRHRLDRQQPHPGRRRQGHHRHDQEPQEVRDQVHRGGGEPGRCAQAGDRRRARHEGRDPRLRHDRRSTTRQGPRPPAAPSCRSRSSGPTSRKPGRPAPMSSSSTRIGARSTRPSRSPPSRPSPGP